MPSRSAKSIALVAAMMVLAGLEDGRATTYDYATTAGSTALAIGSSATVSLQGNAVTINASNKGAGVTLGTVDSGDQEPR